MKSIAIIAIVVIFLFVPISAYATHADDEDYSNDPEYEGKTPLRFYQIFASKDVWYTGACDDAKNSFLRSKTIQVLKMYDYLPITSKMECVKVVGEVEFDKDSGNDDSTFGLSLSEAVSRAKNWHYDLLIIVFDDNFSYEYINETTDLEYKYGWAGHIQYDTNTIVSTTTLLNAEQPESARTMAHEISHFAIEKKFGRTIGGDAVHKVDAEFKQCMNSNSLGSCSHLWTTVKTHYGDPIPVMSPDYVIQVAESMKPKVTKPTTNNSNINNAYTINALRTEYWETQNDLKSKISAKITEYQKLHFDSPLAKAKLGYVLNSLKGINFEYNDYNVQISTENWMKGLGSEGESGVRDEITDIEQNYSTLNNLGNEINLAKKLERESKVKNDSSYNSKSDTQTKLSPSLYALDENGKKSKAINVKTNQKFSVEGYIYKNKIPQKHITYEIYDNVGTSRDGMTNNDGFFKHIFTAKHSNYQVFGQGNEKGSTMIIKACASSNCESVTIHISGNDHTLSTNNEKSIQESESVLKQISTLIEEAQKAEQKTCFLFWCW